MHTAPRSTPRARFRAVLAFAALAAACGEPDPADTVDPQALIDTIRRADRIVVLDWNRDESTASSERFVPVFETRVRDDIDQLADAIRVEKPDGAFWCLCLGGARIRFESGGVETGMLVVHHVRSVSFTTWVCHARLTDPERLLRWFDAHGVTGPREEWDGDRAIDAEWARNRSRWVEAMPASLRVVEAEQDASRPDVDALRSALLAEHASPAPRIRALLGWYGSGAGSWSGYPEYETIAELLLRETSTAALVAAIESAPLGDAEIEGAARFVCDHEFRDVRALPMELRQRIREHVQRTGDEDKKCRMRAALDGP